MSAAYMLLHVKTAQMLSKKFGPAWSLSFAPRSVPSFLAASTSHSHESSHLRISDPLGLDTRPLNYSLPSTRRAWPAMGVRHEPSRAARKARSHSTAMYVSWWFSSARYSAARTSSSRQAIPIAPYGMERVCLYSLATCLFTSNSSRYIVFDVNVW